GGEGQPELPGGDLPGVGELGDEVGLDGDGEQVAGLVQQVLLRVVGVRADLRQVRRVARVDQLLDLAVDVVPGVDADVDLHAGVPGLEPLDQVGPVLPAAGGRAVAVVGGDQLQCHVGRAVTTASAED